MTDREFPRVGTAVWVRKDGKVMLAKRSAQKQSGPGTWCPPGGHLEMLETLEECAIRETREEASIEVSNLRFLTMVEDITPENHKHYLTFHFVADWAAGEPKPQAGESEDWKWFTWEQLPEPLFIAVQTFVALGKNPLEF